MNKKIIDLHDEYHYGEINRREFLKKLAKITGSAAAATALLPILENNYAKGQIVKKDDQRLHTEKITFPGETGDVQASLARPKEAGKHPAVIIIHENRGLNPHIEDVARRAALEGFLAIAPDALSPLGGTPDDTNKARTMLRELNSEDTLKDYLAAVKYLKTHPMSLHRPRAR